MRKNYFILAVVVSAFYALTNIIYFKHNGWLATHGVDIWFFLAAARNMQPLSFLDISFWLVKPFAFFSTENGFIGLIVISVGLHLLSTLLVYYYLGKLLPFNSRLKWFAAFFFAVLPQNLALSTASFTHFTVAQPLLIIAFGELLPWCLKRAPKPNYGGILCLAETLIIGPEGYFLVFCLAAISLSQRIDFLRWLRKIKCPPVVAIVLCCIILALTFSYLFGIWNFFSVHIRGIDLLWQKNIRSGDLLPLSWRFAYFFHFTWLAAAVYGIWKRHFLPAFLILIFLTLTQIVLRAFFTLELVGFASLMFLIHQQDFKKEWQPMVLGVLTGWMLLFGLVSPKTSFMPPHLIRVAKAIRSHAKSGNLIACSPTYGFFFQAWTGLNTTDDLHKPPGLWAPLGAMRPLEACQTMKEKRIAFMILTSEDFKPVAGGDLSSGGLNATLQSLDEKDYELSLVMRALVMNPPRVRPLSFLSDEFDPVTKQRAVCLVPSRFGRIRGPTISNIKPLAPQK